MIVTRRQLEITLFQNSCFQRQHSQKSHLIPKGWLNFFFSAHRLQKPSKMFFIQKNRMCNLKKKKKPIPSTLEIRLYLVPSASSHRAVPGKTTRSSRKRRLFVPLMIPPVVLASTRGPRTIHFPPESGCSAGGTQR